MDLCQLLTISYGRAGFSACRQHSSCITEQVSSHQVHTPRRNTGPRGVYLNLPVLIMLPKCQPSRGGVPGYKIAASCVFLVPVERGPGRDACLLCLPSDHTYLWEGKKSEKSDLACSCWRRRLWSEAPDVRGCAAKQMREEGVG